MIAALPHLDALELKWYFGHGQAISGHSASGAMFDRAETYDNRDTKREQRIAHGRRRQVEARYVEEFGGCVMSFGGQPEITAQPTAEVRPAPSSEVDDEALFRFGKMSTALQRLGRVHDLGRDVLTARYGEGSEEWELKGFALGGIYIMTEAGKELLRRVADGNAKRNVKLDLSPASMLQNDYQRAGRGDDVERLREFGAAHGDATRLLGEVSHVWNQLFPGGLIGR